MKHLDLFSGIGGFSLAADQVWDGVEHTFCEIDPFCQEILKKHWPESKIYGDIRKLTGFGSADIVTGGFPCQPFSSAGRKRGKNDDRDLWPEMFRVIQEAKPAWVIGENVAGFVNMELERSVADLEREGYEVQSFVIPACAVNAPHRRDRVWIIAHSERHGQPAGKELRGAHAAVREAQKGENDPLNASGADRLQGQTWGKDWPPVAARLCGMDDGIPDRVDRLKALGNAIVPQVAREIMFAIKSNPLTSQ